MTFETYVIDNILANNAFEIKKVISLFSLKNMSFDREQYPSIVSLIKENKFDLIKELPFGNNDFEFLEIMSFLDQSGKEYCVTVYSNDSLEHDPQIIDVFKLV